MDNLTVRAGFTNAGHTITAVLSFDTAGPLTSFWSDDRLRTTDGKTYAHARWTTPVLRYREFGGRRVPAEAEARWTQDGKEYAYATFEVDSLEFNLGK